MTAKQIRDLCGLYCVAEFANYEGAEFFMYWIGTGVTRSLYELTADRKTGALLFDMPVEASAAALEMRVEGWHGHRRTSCRSGFGLCAADHRGKIV